MVKTIIFTGPNKVAFKEEIEEKLKDNQIRAKTLFSGISHGTELSFYRGLAPSFKKKYDSDSKLFIETKEETLKYPISYGYAAVGEVIEIGKDVSRFSKGDIILSYKPHTTEFIFDENDTSILILPSNIKPEIGIFRPNLRTAFNAILDSRINIGEFIAVFGLGTVGQMVSQIVKLSGAKVIGIDYFKKRLEIAKSLGTDIVLNPKEFNDIGYEIKKLTENKGADLAIEVSGSYHALHQAIRSVGYEGTVIAMSFYQGEGKNLYLGEEFHSNRIIIKSSQVSGIDVSLLRRWDTKRRDEIALSLLDKLQLEELITHIFDFEDAVKAYKLIDEHPEEVIQVIFRYK